MNDYETAAAAAKAARAASEAKDAEFYQRVAAIIGGTHEGQPFRWHARTRWNNRIAGQGRYPGFGTVRLFGDIVHVALRHPVALHAAIEGREAAIAAISEAMAPKP
jgi:hypothetical protein